MISSFAILPCHAGGRAYLRNRSQSWQCLIRGREGEQMRSNVLCRFCFFSADPTASAESLHLLWELAYRIRKSEWNTRGKFAQHFFCCHRTGTGIWAQVVSNHAGRDVRAFRLCCNFHRRTPQSRRNPSMAIQHSLRLTHLYVEVMFVVVSD